MAITVAAGGRRTGRDRGKTTLMVGTQIVVNPTKGKFCIIAFSLKSFNGKGAFHEFDQHAYDAAGTKYDMAVGADVDGLVANTFADEGKSYDNFIVFDVPLNATVVSLEFRGADSNGDPVAAPATIHIG